jgi:hypothetical protein
MHTKTKGARVKGLRSLQSEIRPINLFTIFSRSGDPHIDKELAKRVLDRTQLRDVKGRSSVNCNHP